MGGSTLKLYHFTLVFAVFAALMLIMMNLAVSETLAENADRSFLDKTFDRAVDAAAAVLAQASASGIYGVRDEAADAFYESLAAGLGLLGNACSEEQLRLYVPMLLITDGTTVYVCSDEYNDGPVGSMLTRVWSGAIDASEAEMEELLEFYCSEHNEVARRAGISYTFTVPEEEGGMFLRGSIGLGIYAFLQGYPVNDSTGTVYSRYSFAGAAVREADTYYINLKGEGYESSKYYHSFECGFRSGETAVCRSKKECALCGAGPCPECCGPGMR